jgi:hypothetical protein
MVSGRSGPKLKVKLRNNSRMPGSMLILTWVGIIFVIILHRATARCKILTNIMPTHVIPKKSDETNF